MIMTLIISIGLLIALWPYFSSIGILDYKSDPNEMEPHLPGRPARRNIGRKNEDISKAISYIFIGHLLFNAALYGLLDYKDLLPSYALMVIGWFGSGLAFFLFSPANRLAHAYVEIGHIAVIHLMCSLSAFLLVTLVIFDLSPEQPQLIGFIGMAAGAMMLFSKGPDIEAREKALKQARDQGGF